MYKGLENIFYLVTQEVIPKPSIGNFDQVDKIRLWSSRYLISYFLINLVKLVRAAWITKSEGLRPSESIEEDGMKSIGSKDAESRVSEWRKSLLRTVIWSSLCTHWSLCRGVGIQEGITGILALIAQISVLRDMYEKAKLN